MEIFVPGQRWLSTAEPELGLGTVMRLAGRSVQIVFTGSGVVRQYAFGSAPLMRAAFRPGDRIRVDGSEVVIERVEADNDLLVYVCGAERYPEGMLDAQQPVSQADTRLLAGRLDRSDQFDFRLELLQRRAAARTHPGWGLIGARVDLIAHQLRVAEIAAARRPPRLLLADEVGLGKTIEACLIVSQQLAVGRARRILVLVPESLVNQWFVELLRRFNLAFAIYDEERCESLELNEPHRNPFEDEQCVIASSDWLARDGKRARQALAAQWDMLLVDEAHHLVWTPDFASPGYQLVEALAAKTPGLLLLTATPEQLGLGGHFARLRLLDPARYHSLVAFEAETRRYQRLSKVVDALQAGAPLSLAETEALGELFEGEADILPALLGAIAEGDESARVRLIDALIDRHGTGRVMVRNRRAAVGGFPQRIKHIDILTGDGADPTLHDKLLAEFLHDVGEREAEPEHDYTRDPRMDWLLALLDRVAPAKVLLLCRSRGKVQALEEALRLRSGVQAARFHEDMNLLQRDRNAAWFADPEGARLLVASEIGAEGRNFQFAQHLVLWDLPIDPDMLEQRIGRLDRIGQRGDVNIHLPAVAGSPQETLLRWYDEGLDAFSRVLADGRELLRRFGDDVVALAIGEASAKRDADIDALLSRSREAHAELARLIAEGRDRLLELGSQRGAGQSELLAALAEDDQRVAGDDFPLRLIEQIGVHHEDLGGGLWLLDPEHITVDGFEEFKNGPRPATFDRSTALARDDVLYLRDDHPLLLSVSELLLSGETGNAAFLVDELPPRTVILEAVFVLECVARRALNAERFLPPTPLRVAIDTRLQPRNDFSPSERARLRAGERQIDLSPMRKVLATLVPPMLERARQEAKNQSAARIAEAVAAAGSLLGHEIVRLEALARVNPAVRPEEIASLRDELQRLSEALPTARPRLDALRLVASPDFLSLRR